MKEENDYVLAMVNLANAMQDWIEDRDGLSSWPCVEIRFQRGFVTIYIGGDLLFEAQEGSPPVPTLAELQDLWLDEIEGYEPFMADVKARQEKRKKDAAELPF